MTIIKSNMNKVSSSTYMLESSDLWHGRLGHVNYDTICKLINLDHIRTFQIDSKHKCETCVKAKLTKSSFQSIERHTELLDFIHSDIGDLKFVQTRCGNKYFITFVDDSTKYCYVYLLKSKDEAIEKFVLYKIEVDNQLNKKIKVFRSDRGGKYEPPFADFCAHFIEKFVLYKIEVDNQLNKKIKVFRSDRGGKYEPPFADFCAHNGIIHETTSPYSPQSNGVVEQKNHTLKEMMNAMLISFGLP